MDDDLLRCKTMAFHENSGRGKWNVVKRLWDACRPDPDIPVRKLQYRVNALDKVRRTHLPPTRAEGSGVREEGLNTGFADGVGRPVPPPLGRRDMDCGPTKGHTPNIGGTLPPMCHGESVASTSGGQGTIRSTPRGEGGAPPPTRELGESAKSPRGSGSQREFGADTRENTNTADGGTIMALELEQFLNTWRKGGISKAVSGSNDPSPSVEGCVGPQTGRDVSDVDDAWRQRLAEEFAQVLGETRGSEGCFKSRKRVPSITGGRVNLRAVKAVDGLIATMLHENPSAWSLNCLVYAGALVVERRSRRAVQVGPGKSTRLGDREAEIRSLRRRIGWLHGEISKWETNTPPVARETRVTRRLRKIYGRKANNLRELRIILTEEKGLLNVRASQARGLRERLKYEAAQFEFAEKGPKCLEGVGPSPAMTDQKAPSANEISRFWGGLLGVAGEFNLDDPAFKKWKRSAEASVAEEGESWSSVDDVWEQVLKKAKNWRAPGPDRIKAGWWKLFSSAREALKQYIVLVLAQTAEVPQWLVTGRTVLIPKDGCAGRPDQYRPIACLNTSYKLLTAVMSRQLTNHVMAYNLLPDEQLALRQGRRGCTDALLIDAMVGEVARSRNAGLSVAWIDFKKAYDRVPFAVITEVLRSCGVPHTFLGLLRVLMGMWSSVFEVRDGKKTVKVNVDYHRGLLQGDALSPLIFCLCIAPVSVAIRDMKQGYRPLTGPEVTHLFFMDDLKVYCHGRKALATVLVDARRTAGAVGMELGLTKCAEAHKTGGRINGELLATADFRRATGESPYTYLGVDQVILANSRGILGPLRQEYLRRVRKVWLSNLSGKNKVRAHNTWAVSLFRYYFGNLEWALRDIDALDIKTRKLLRHSKSHHLNAAVERLYLPRDAGGRGLTSLRHCFEREKVSVAKYVADSEVPRLVQVRENWAVLRGRGRPTPMDNANKILARYAMPSIDGTECSDAQTLAKTIKARQFDGLYDRLKSKILHRENFETQTRDDYDTEMSRLWLSDGRLKSRTEGLICAMQDGVVWTRAYRKRIVKASGTFSDRCRMCHKAPETLGHLLSSCDKLTWTLYKDRHDRVLYQVLRAFASASHLTIPNNLHWTTTGWSGIGVLESDDIKITIDVNNPTIQVMEERRPDLILYLKKEKRILITEIAVCWDPILPVRETQKRDKYQKLARDLCRQLEGWSAEVYPLAFGDLGSIRGLREELKNMKLLDPKGVVNLIRDAQRETLCSAVRIVRNVLAHRD